MRVEDLVDRLAHLGLEPAEARAYVHLNTAGPSKASDVALAMRIHRTDAYRTLQRLVALGFATASLDRPVVFEALPADVVFKRMEQERAAQLADVGRVREEVSEALSHLRSDASGRAPRESFRIIHGRSEIYKAMMQLMRGARDLVRSVNTNMPSNVSAEASGAWAVAKERAAEGLRIRAVNWTTPGMRQHLLTWVGLPVDVRHLEHERPMRFLIADDDRLIIFTRNDLSPRLGAEDEVALETDSADLVAAQVELFEALWPRGVPLAEVDAHNVRIDLRQDDVAQTRER